MSLKFQNDLIGQATALTYMMTWFVIQMDSNWRQLDQLGLITGQCSATALPVKVQSLQHMKRRTRNSVVADKSCDEFVQMQWRG